MTQGWVQGDSKSTRELKVCVSNESLNGVSAPLCHCSRIGLDWASSVADILRNLNACPQWCDVIAGFTDHCIQQLPHQLKRTNIFTLHVLVIFPEVRG